MSKINNRKKSLLRAGRVLDKYRIEGRLADGMFAAVYKAYDIIEGVRVALKIPHAQLMDDQFLDDFRKEVRLSSRLDHGNILQVKNASFIDGYFVIVLPLGERTLADRLQSRMSLRTALMFFEQALDALTHAHEQRIIHCDIKPENFILFAGDHLRLADFGISKLSLRTVMEASGSGTVGYMAPEQAMGRPSFKSDVFSLGLILYRMLSGTLPEWPFEWPPRGYERIHRRVHPDLIGLMRKTIDIDPARRFRDAAHMQASFEKIQKKVLDYSPRQRRRKKGNRITRDWQEVRRRQFQRASGRILETRFNCKRCGGPVSESMLHCPWCGTGRKIFRDDTRFPARCPRCKRGVKLDWKYCPWCYGSSIGPVADRAYTDVRYSGRCTHGGCSRKELMPFMRYCPWCRRAVQRKWKVPGSNGKCPSCQWGVLPVFWSFCPWCGKALKKP